MCGAGGAERIVLMHDGDAEDRHDRIADELLDGAAVALQHLAPQREIPFHRAAKRLRVEPFAERRRPGHVAEEDGHGLPDLSRRRRLGERRSAGPAETEPLGILCATARANGHPGERNWHGRELRSESTRCRWVMMTSCPGDGKALLA